MTLLVLLCVVVLSVPVAFWAYRKQKKRTFIPRGASSELHGTDNGSPFSAEEVHFNEDHHHQRDDLLQYDADRHQYLFQETPLVSVYDAVEALFPVFDAAGRSVDVAEREGRSPQYVRERWESDFRLTRQTGGFLHLQFDHVLHRREPFYTFRYSFLGRYFRIARPVSVCQEMNQFVAYAPSLTGLKPYRSLWRIFDGEARLTGVVDLLLRDADGRFVYHDWTYNRTMGREADGAFELRPKAGAGVGLGPLSTVADTPFMRAAVRMNVLRAILKRRYGIQVDEMRLVVFHEQNATAHALPMPLLEREAGAVMATLAQRQS
jgi:hypothetical protein